MRLLIDMNLTPRWVAALGARGYEAVHWSTIGEARAPDREIFDYARQNDFVLLTSDLDFPQILAHTRASKPSVVLLRSEPLTPELRVEPLIGALAECRKELDAGAILTIDWSERPRAHLLPL